MRRSQFERDAAFATLRVGAATAALVIMGAMVSTLGSAPVGGKLLIAHRGASAYAPEHTRLAYELGITQGADFIEPDLAVTKDNILICLHDDTLNRTTDVAHRFPERGRDVMVDGRPERVWLPSDFTLAELQTLDFGAWFDPRTAGERVVTFDEAIAIAKAGKVGLVPELKSQRTSRESSVNMVSLVASALRRHGLDTGSADTAVMLQTFDEATARALALALPKVKRVLLVGETSPVDYLSDAGLDSVATYATGIGPSKALIDGRPDVVGRAHVRGLTVMPWTFRASEPSRFPDVAAEMGYYLNGLGVDGLFTDNPDLFPRAGR